MSVSTRWPAFALDHASRSTPSSSSRSTNAALAADSIHTTFEASASSSGPPPGWRRSAPARGAAPADGRGRPGGRGGAPPGAAVGRLRAAAMNCSRSGAVRRRASASSSAVALRGVWLMPRSRSLTVRGLIPAAEASSSWVSPRSARSCRSNSAYWIAGCSNTVGIPSQAFAFPCSPGPRSRCAGSVARTRVRRDPVPRLSTHAPAHIGYFRTFPVSLEVRPRRLAPLFRRR